MLIKWVSEMKRGEKFYNPERWRERSDEFLDSNQRKIVFSRETIQNQPTNGQTSEECSKKMSQMQMHQSGR